MKTKKSLLGLLTALVMVFSVVPSGTAWALPTLQNVSISTAGVLTWDPLPDAGGYFVDVERESDGSGGFGGNFSSPLDIAKKLTDSGNNPSGRYKVEVYAVDKTGSGGRPISEKWTGTYNFTNPKPQLATPTNVRWSGNTVSWNAVPNTTTKPTKYHVFINRNWIETTSTSVDVSPWIYESSAEHYYTIHASATGYLNSEQYTGKRTTVSFTRPSLTNVSISSYGVLTWDAFPDAAAYNIDVDRPDGTGLTGTWHTGTSYDLYGVLKSRNVDNGTYTINLYAANQTGQYAGTLSKTWTGTYNYVSQTDYNVTFDKNASDATGSMAKLTHKLPGSTVTLPDNKFARTGYTFAGWNTKADGSGAPYADGALFTMPNANVTLYAQWTQNKYDVSFAKNASDATGSMATLTGNPYGSTVTLPANTFTRSGYKFTGWNRKADGTGASYADEASFTIPNANTTLYAQWKKAYNVSFDGNGATSGSMAALTDRLPGSTVTLPANGFSRTNYKFTGWNTKKDGSGTPYADKAQFTIPNTNTTLYAQWVLNIASVTFDSNGANGSMAGLYALTPGSTITLPANEFTHPWYAFAGWNTKKDGSGTPYADGAQFTVPSGGAVLYAQWAKKVRLIFDKNADDATGNNFSQNHASGSTVILTANNFKRTGYTFAGWNTAADGFGTAYADKASFTVPDVNTTLYAQWTKNKLNIVFDGNGATGGSMAVLTGLDYDSEVTLPVNEFARENHTFIGWNTKSNGSGVSYDDEDLFTVPDEDTVLYAQWEADKCSLTFHGNGATGGSMAVLTGLDYDSLVTLPANRFTREGYTFKGWSTDVTGTGTVYRDKDLLRIQGDRNLYAQWEKIPSVKPTPTGTPSGKPSTPGAKPSATSSPKPSTTPSASVSPKPSVSPSVKPSPTSSPKPGGSCDVSGGSQEVYRLYNPVTSEHLFTTDKKEYEALAAKHGWKQEGTAWVSPDATASSVGVYRLYNPGLGDHHYTKDQNEAAALVNKFGWVYDNDAKPLFYSDDECQRVPVYRQYNGGLTSGQHHYTADENEAKALITKHGWKNEAIGWYAISWK